jgi:phosphate transport system substrate-binding protein
MRTLFTLFTVIGLCAVATQAPATTQVPDWAQYVSSLPPYHPAQPMTGTVRSWGHGFLKVMMHDWEQGFHRYQPGIRFQDDLVSSAAAIPGLYTGRANLGVLAREIVPMESAAYRKVTGQPPFGVTVLTGSRGDPDKITALGLFVNKNSPIARLDFRQLDAIFDARPNRGEPRSIRSWGQLGLTGAWRNQPIHLYSGPASDEAPAFYFSQRVMRGSDLWSCALQQLDEKARPGGGRVDGYQRAVDAVAADPYGVALTAAGDHAPGAKLLAIAVRAGGPYVRPTLANVADRTYPLSRAVKFYINDGPKIAPDPAVLEFLRYILSRQGQEQVLREGSFLPLTPAVVAAERGKLSAAASTVAAQRRALQLVRRIPVPEMTGTWDHMTVDPTTDRLFLSAQDQQRVYVIPLKGGAIHGITGDFDRPQGELYVPHYGRLVVTNGRSGRVLILDGQNEQVVGSLKISLGADMIAFDRRHRVLYVESGGTDSRRGIGWLAVVDPGSGALRGRIDTGYRAAALVMARTRPRLYAAIPGLDQVLVIDTRTRRIVRRLPVPGRPASMALDESHGRLFVATRTFSGDPRPPTFNVLDARTGTVIASLPSKDATEDMYFDRAQGLIYASSLEGFVQAYREIDADHFESTAAIRTEPHSGTSQFVSGLDELCVAVPPTRGRAASVWIFRPAANASAASVEARHEGGRRSAPWSEIALSVGTRG